MLKLITTILLALSVSACVSSNIARYSITSNILNYDVDDSYEVNVKMPLYLSCSGIVLQTSDVSFVEAVNNKWVEPITTQIQMLVENKIIDKKLPKDLSYFVYVSKFNGSTNGKVFTSLSISVKKQNKELLSFNKDLITNLSGDGYDILVADLRDNLNLLLDDFITKAKVSL